MERQAMSRSIKFRVWTGDLNAHLGSEPSMLYWYPVPIHLQHKEGNDRFSLDNWLTGDRIGNVMQYTGFTDHDGNEIYEKDIVQFNHPTPKKNNKRPQINMVVSWNAKNGCWALYWQSLDGELRWATLGKQLDENHTVVGNIYETPELINGR